MTASAGHFTRRTEDGASAGTAICWQAPRTARLQRQIDRLQQAVEHAQSRGVDIDADGVKSSIEILKMMSNLPFPIPTASWSDDTGSSLFYGNGSFYGDLEFSGKHVEYLLKGQSDGGDVEVYDEEEIEAGRIPPRLLVHLFSSLSRVGDDVR